MPSAGPVAAGLEPAAEAAADRGRQAGAGRRAAGAHRPAAALERDVGARPDAPQLELEADDDPIVALTRQLIQRLAPLLGLDAATVSLTIGAAGPGSPARGSARPGALELAIAAGSVPPTPLLVHELAHVAQHANATAPAPAWPVAAAPALDVTRAESEAAGLAHAAAAGRGLWVPLAALPAHHVARDADASGVAAKTPPPDVEGLRGRLDEAVRITHAAEKNRIAAAFDSIWTLTEEAIDASLQILEGFDFVTARAIVRVLKPAQRRRLARLRATNHRHHPGAAVAVLAGLSKEDMDAIAATTPRALHIALEGIQTVGAGPDRLRGTLDALRKTPVAELVRLQRGDRGAFFRELLSTAAPPGTEAASLQTALDREEPIRAAAAVALAKSVVEEIQAIQAPDSVARAMRALAVVARVAAPLLPAAPERTAANPGMAPERPVVPTPVPERTAANPGMAPERPVESTPAHNPAPTTTSPPARPGGTNAPRAPHPHLIAIVAAMDAAGLVERILETLPEPMRYTGETATHLRLVLTARSPALSLPRIEDLLSYGLFDWAVTDENARFANLLVRSMPIEAQDIWRLRDGGKWFQRLEGNIPEELVITGEYTGVGSEYHVGGIDEAGLDQAAIIDLLRELLELWRTTTDALSAEKVARRLLGRYEIGGQPNSKAPDVRVRTAVVRRLDTLGVLDSMYNAFSDAYLLDEGKRGEILELTQMRDPIKVEQRAAALLETGIFDWWVNAREAWVASQLMRALPPATQRAWAAADPDRWSLMMEKLTPEMRRSLATTALTGSGPFPTRAAIRGRLEDPRLWELGQTPVLRALAALARASDDGPWVFDQSRIRAAYTRPWLQDMVAAFELYDPRTRPPRTEYVPEILKTRWWGEELFQIAAGYVRIGLFALGTWLIFDEVSIGGKSVTFRDLDLNRLQWAMGGDLSGAQLARKRPLLPADAPAAPRPEPLGPGAPLPRQRILETNRLSGAIDVDTGAVRLSLPTLELKGLNIVRPGASYRTGRLVLRGVELKADFSDRHYREPAGAILDAKEVSVDDLVVANELVPGGALALAHLLSTTLHLRAGASGEENFDLHQPREGTIPIPIFGPLIAALTNIVAIKGGIPFDFTVLDYALMPLTWGMNPIASKAITLSANALVPTPQPATYLWGLVSDGTLRPPRSVSERAKDAGQLLRSFEFSFKELTLTGLTLGASTQIASVSLKDVTLGAGLSRPAYLRLLRGSLQRALAGTDEPKSRAAIERQIDAINGQLYGKPDKPGLEPLERELEELERRERWIAGSLKAPERARMAELSDLLRSTTGVVGDIGEISLGAVTGAIQTGGATIKGIHFDGHVPIQTRGYLAADEIASRFVAGGPKTATVAEMVKESEANLTIQSAELIPLPDGVALRVLADAVPSSGDLEARLAAMEPGVDTAIRSRIEQALTAVREIERLRALEGTARAGAQASIASLEDQVRQLLGIEVGSLTLGPIDGGLNPKTGALEARIRGVDARNIAGSGFAVRRVHGDVRLGVGGLLNLNTAPGAVTADTASQALKAQFGLDVTAEGVRTEFGDVGEATVSGLRGEVTTLADGYRLSNGGASRLVLHELNLNPAGVGLRAKNVTIEGLAVDGELHNLPTGGTRTVVSRLAMDRLTATNLVYDSTDPADSSTMHIEVSAGTLGGIEARNLTIEPAAGGRRVSFEGSIAAVSGVQYQVILGSLDPKTKERRETTITGKAEGGTMPPPGTAEAGRAKVEGKAAGTADGPAAKTGTGAAGATAAPAPVLTATYVQSPAAGKTFSLRPKDLDLFGTEVRTPDGSVVITRARLTGQIDKSPAGIVLSAHLANVEIGAIDWKAGSGRVTSTGGTTIRSLDVRGARDAAVPDDPDPIRRHGRLRVDELDAQDLAASNLRYLDPPIDVSLGRLGKTHPGELRVGRVRLRNFVLPYAADGSFASPTAGKLEVTGTHLDFGGTVAKGMKASGELSVESLTVDILRDDAFVARLRGVGGDASIDASGLHAHAVLDDLDTGEVTITPDAILVGGPGRPGLHIEQIMLDQFDISSSRGAHPFKLRTTPGGAVYVIGIDASGRVERWKPGETHPTDQPFRRAVIDHFEIQRIDAEGLKLELPSDGVTIEVPLLPTSATGALPHPATIRHITLAGETPGSGFEFVPGKAGFAKGIARLDELAVPALKAEVAGRIKGSLDLHTDAGSIRFVERGPNVIDVANPRARMSTAATMGADSILVKEIGADSIHAEGSSVKITGAHADELVYTQPGITVKARRVSAPGVVDVTPTTGTIPELKVEDAALDIQFWKLPPSSGSTTPAAIGIDDPSLGRLLDSLQGSLKTDVFLRINNLPVFDDVDLRIPVDVSLVDGRINYQQVQDALAGRIGVKVANEPNETSWAKAFVRPEFWMEGNDLVVGLHLFDLPSDPDGFGEPVPILKEVTRWHLDTGEVTPARDRNLLRLYRAINPAPSTSGGGGAAPQLDTLELQNIDVNLDVRSGAPIPVTVTGSKATGSVILSPGALIGLKVKGQVLGDVRTTSRGPAPGPGALTGISVDAINIDRTDLRVGGAAVTTDGIQILRLRNGKVTFVGHKPDELHMEIEEATAKNVHWDLAPAAKP